MALLQLRVTSKKMFFQILTCIFILHGSSAFARETIIWAMNDLIPFYIKEEPFQGKGISDQLTGFFQRHLPQYNHVQEDMTFTRFFARSERGDLVCNPLLLKTADRAKKLYFSEPVKPNYAHVLVSKKRIEHPKEGLHLGPFLHKQATALIIQKKRSYGPEIDVILEEEKKNEHVKEGVFSTKQLIAMLESDRIDFFLDTESSALYLQRSTENIGTFYNIPLAEDRLDRFGYAVCSKTANGQKVIEAINTVLKQHQNTEEFKAILEYWVSSENMDRFRAFYDREILQKTN